MSALRALGAWASPVLIGAVAAHVCAGDPDAPFLVLAAALAPLMALLRPPCATAPPRHVVITAALALSLALMVWANLLLLGEAASLLAGRRWPGVALGAVLALLVAVTPRLQAWRAVTLATGGAALLAALTLASVAAGVAPWTAWRETAARPALVFSAAGAWAGAGERLARDTTLTFDEAHRVVAVAPGTFTVVEAGDPGRVVREWPLEAGDALVLRPGDQLTAPAGSRLRFEGGKRVPGAPPSGAAWAAAADGRGRVGLWAGLLLTLTLGAVALLPSGTRRGALAPAMLVATPLGAACWGLYAVHAAPELPLGGALAASLLRLPAAPVALVAAGLGVLFFAVAGALHDHLAAAAPSRTPVTWIVIVATAAIVAGIRPVDPWTAWGGGLGLAGAAIAAPRLAAGHGAGRRLGWPVEAFGALTGGALCVALTLAAMRVPPALAPLALYPVLGAAPAAWGIVRLLRTPPTCRPS
jgi:hypothetical protein